MSNSSAIAKWAELTRPAPKAQAEPRPNTGLRRLVWAYFWLLIFEGVLRKWVVPSLATPLLLVRDPIPVLILFLGIRNRVFPRTIAVYLTAGLATAMVGAGLFVLHDSPHVVLYGFKCDFLHLAMLVITPIVFEAEDLDRMIRWIIIVSVPIALLMAWQFYSAPTAWINSGLDGTFKQLDSTQGRIRPPGPFSFTAGSACFCSLLAAVVMGSAADRRKVPRTLLFVGAGSLIVSALFSASRGLVGDVLIVLAAGLFGALAGNRQVFGRFVGVAAVMGLIALVIGTSSVMQESVDVFSSRVETATQQEAGSGGILARVFGDYASVIPAVEKAPFAGYGLGVGTNGGAWALTGNQVFLLAEREWARIVYESGPVLGLLYIGLRVTIALWLGWRALVAIRRGTVLGACLFGGCATAVVTAQFGQGTELGFAMLTAGLCLTACKRPDELPESAAARREPFETISAPVGA